ncbi:DUF928 domain-containing protein [Leptolyngbya sp. FACHB-8]|uniref:DUF928 domain-containing protein n=1 Tax=unclassified Leptolyngbya TaxID=2650499 RepID=UPI001689D37A|nr:DUF928 domain-containing protein [Leptolyngbya sp. FACHB-8]MBD2158197.1 DUF928 domain-containing protein [Leptolyngbya sp. FACHB-16]
MIPVRVAAQSSATGGTFTPPPPPVVGEPGGRGQGGGSRSPECERYADVTALVPTVQVGDRTFQWGLTTRSHPTVWLSAPAGLADAVPIEFTLWSEDPQPIYRTLLTSTATAPGAFRVTFPEDTPALSTGTVYHWTVSIFCNPETPDVPVRVDAYIQRTELSIPQETSDVLQTSAAYARGGVWYDALSLLGEQYGESGDEAIAAAWTDLLQQVNLHQLPNRPIGACCQTSP